jgi:hypothetical membrane protein
VALALWVLLLEAWFRGPVLGRFAGAGVAAILVAALAVAVGLHLSASRAGKPAVDRALALVVLATLAAATLVRLPALAAPAGLISSDSAVAGFIAQDLRAGKLPAPIYAPGFPYEGTLKPHLTALLGLAVPAAGTPALYAVASHLFYLLWCASAVVLAHRAAGLSGAAAAGAFMAVSPRFLAAFSLNNVGQYPEVNALGAFALLLLTRQRDLLLAGFVLGLAVWQQLLAVYFVAAVAVAALLTPVLRRPASLLAGVLGFAAGSYPMWVWNARHGWGTFDFFRRGGKNPADRLAGVPDRLEAVATVSFPKMFGLTDLGVGGWLAVAAGLVLPALVLAAAWSRRRELRERRGRSPVFLALVLAAVVLGVFSASKFSHRGAQRPRYLLPLYTSIAVAGGAALRDLSRRSRLAALSIGAAVLAVNAAGLVPWLRARADADARDRAFVRGLVERGVRTGYSGFWIAAKYTFLAEGEFVLSGELGPDVSWVHAGHARLVQEAGPDAYVAWRDDLADALEARLHALGCRFERSEVGGRWLFHSLSRRVTLEDVSGYDSELDPAAAPESEGAAE